MKVLRTFENIIVCMMAVFIIVSCSNDGAVEEHEETVPGITSFDIDNSRNGSFVDMQIFHGSSSETRDITVTGGYFDSHVVFIDSETGEHEILMLEHGGKKFIFPSRKTVAIGPNTFAWYFNRFMSVEKEPALNRTMVEDAAMGEKVEVMEFDYYRTGCTDYGYENGCILVNTELGKAVLACSLDLDDLDPYSLGNAVSIPNMENCHWYEYEDCIFVIGGQLAGHKLYKLDMRNPSRFILINPLGNIFEVKGFIDHYVVADDFLYDIDGREPVRRIRYESADGSGVVGDYIDPETVGNTSYYGRESFSIGSYGLNRIFHDEDGRVFRFSLLDDGCFVGDMYLAPGSFSFEFYGNGDLSDIRMKYRLDGGDYFFDFSLNSSGNYECRLGKNCVLPLLDGQKNPVHGLRTYFDGHLFDRNAVPETIGDGWFEIGYDGMLVQNETTAVTMVQLQEVGDDGNIEFTKNDYIEDFQLDTVCNILDMGNGLYRILVRGTDESRNDVMAVLEYSAKEKDGLKIVSSRVLDSFEFCSYLCQYGKVNYDIYNQRVAFDSTGMRIFWSGIEDICWMDFEKMEYGTIPVGDAGLDKRNLHMIGDRLFFQKNRTATEIGTFSIDINRMEDGFRLESSFSLNDRRLTVLDLDRM